MNFKILVLKTTNNLGIFKIYPINNGNGITIGNTLRRILLSSLYGYSVSYFKIKGVLHEFSTIKGIIEDVPEIILNLKQIRFKLKKNNLDIEKEKIKIKIKNKKTKIYAGDIERYSKYFEITNKKLVICNKDESVYLNMKLIVDKGIGYLPSEKKKEYKKFIAIDSIYTPIKNVSFKVINYSYKNINKEILNLNIITDGTISPIKSLIQSSKILINIFNNFTNQRQYYKKKNNKKTKKYDENYIKIKKILNTKLEKENFTVRTINCLNSSKIYKWNDLVIFKKSDLLKIKNFGKKSLKELIKKMDKRNLQFEMDIKKYN
ncbi:MAG: DNA-directed RNA polymerase subunit alpha [Candidatus Shikimatogenerans bostrichidophilus]|nr:MAG: DNA-directed RNA polymerase subunit alpha [Candidatus Shikimatogenerans bostrichidophilus]